MLLIKKIIRFTAFFITGFTCIAVLYLIIALIVSKIPVNSNFKESPEGIEIFLLSNGIHTNFVLPVQSEVIDWHLYLPRNHLEIVDSSFKYITFGWGDKDFYINTPAWADLTFSVAFKAIFFLGNGALNINYLHYKPTENELSKRLMISKEEYMKLVDYIKRAFEKDNLGNLIPIKHRGYSKYDFFYEAEGTFSFLKTCNVWIGNGLKEAGIKTGIWTPFDFSVFNSLN